MRSVLVRFGRDREVAVVALRFGRDGKVAVVALCMRFFEPATGAGESAT